MMRNTEVAQMMTLVEGALLRAENSDPGPPIILTPDGESDLHIARLRHRAHIQLDVHSGSARPVVGPAIVLAKRLVRRGLRWYVAPMFEQQTDFNHHMLDLFERTRLDNERLRSEVARLRRPAASDAGPAPDVVADGRPGRPPR